MRTRPQFPELGALLKEKRKSLSAERLDMARAKREVRWNKTIPRKAYTRKIFKASTTDVVLSATGEPDAGHKLYDLENGYVRALESSHAFIEKIIEYYGITRTELLSIDYYARMEELKDAIKPLYEIKRPIYLDPLRKNGGKSLWV